MSRPALRNAPCPCGSGRKYKHCCLADAQRAEAEARIDDAVGRRIQDWSAAQFHDEIGTALEEYVGPERVMDDADVEIFGAWFHNDREFADGGTPAERYAARPGLAAEERDVASRIAGAQLGLYRVLTVEPGLSLTLHDILRGDCVAVRSPHVSREAVRWDVLLARVMPGEPPSLWGPVRTFEPRDEDELLAAFERLAGATLAELDNVQLAAAFRRHALALMRFAPTRARVEPSYFTLEGDPVVFASATWRVLEPSDAAARLRSLGGLLPDEPVEIDLTAPRAALVAERPGLPPGALVLESSPAGASGAVHLATLRLEGERLHAEAISAERLERTIELVAEDLGALVELAGRETLSVDEALESRSRRRSPRLRFPARLGADERGLMAGLVTERMVNWLDEPNPSLGGCTPREAAAGRRRAEVVQLLRQLENGAERARRDGEPAVDVARLRAELGLGDALAA